MSKITVAEFENRLETLCLRSSGQGLPKKERDRKILFKSIMLTLDSNRQYTETELNLVLEKWLIDIGRMLNTDHVTLRRYMVDHGYLSRDPAGTVYKIHPEKMVDLFDAAIDALDPVLVLDQALERRAQQKQAYQQNKHNN